MSEPAPDPPRSLEDLLQAWIDTETWKASHDFLATYAGQLLSDDALHTLDAMFAQGESKQDEADDREKREREQAILQQHRAILETARDSSIDEAYADLLMPSALQEALTALWQARPGGLPRVVEQHPLLLEAETIRVLLAWASRIEREGDRASAQALRFRIGEVQRLRQQQERLQQSTQEAPPVQEGPQQVEMSATRGGFNVCRNEGTINSTYVEHAENVITVPQEIAFPPLNWLPPAAPSHPEGRTFIGREQDLQKLRDALLAGNEVATTGIAPTIMLHGMAGTGKTYLATQLAIEVQSYFPGGVLPVGLSGIRPKKDVQPTKKDVQPTPEEKAQPILQDLAAYAFNGQKDQFTRPLQPE